jgi:hypothetical protein
MYAEESVDLLQNSGLQFDRHEREGIETVDFAEMLIVSGGAGLTKNITSVECMMNFMVGLVQKFPIN